MLDPGQGVDEKRKRRSPEAGTEQRNSKPLDGQVQAVAARRGIGRCVVDGEFLWLDRARFLTLQYRS